MGRRALARWARAESLKLSATWPLGSPLDRRVPEAWKVHRPEMLRSLGASAKLLAHVLVHKGIEAEMRNLKAGQPPPDDWEQA
jgi:hypothetical protein